MELTIDDVRHVAALARLGLSDAEAEQLRTDLSSILEHMQALGELDTDAIAPTAQTIAVSNVWREDDVQPSLPRELVLLNAPRQRNGYFEVHTPLGGEESES
jgi:aspartyl-tRNA(Asn)/glutamyl-tRNA(Gln) amidotransferase subunit C